MRSDLVILRLVHQRGCTVAHLAVYAALHTRSTFKPNHPDYGWARASVEKIMTLTSLSRSTVLRALRWLEQCGALTVRRSRQKIAGEGTKQAVNRYWLMGMPAPSQSVTDDTLAPRPRVSKSADPRVSADDTLIRRDTKQHRDTACADAPSENGKRPDTWLTPYGQAWVERFGGEPPWGIMARSLAKPHAEIGAQECLHRWTRFLQQSEPQFVSVPKFASTHGSYNGQSPTLTPRNARNRAALTSWSPDA